MPAPDVFISYAHEDIASARMFADAFTGEGLDVWWDNSLQAGEIFDERIEDALRAAKVVVVLWSPHSVVSRWVRAEATLADRNRTLVPAMIAPCERPIIFELTHTAALAHWQGEADDPEWQAFLANIRRMVGETAPAPQADHPAVPLPRLDQVSIVVLPFANMSRDDEQEYFADGVSEDIITDLSKVSALSVIARNTAFTFKGKPVDVKQVANQLNVTHVLEGSVRRSGDRVRITAQLIDGAAGDHVWAERYDRDMGDIFALQDEISQEIVKALKLRLLPQEKKAIEDRGTDNAEAYDLYLRAASFSRSFRPDDARRAIDLFHQVLAIEPNFALAWSGLGVALSRAIINDAGDHAQLLVEFTEAHAQVQTLAPDAWFTQLSWWAVHSHHREWVEAEASVGRAIERAPAAQPRAMTARALTLSHVGRSTEAAEAMRMALRADPLSIEQSFLMQMLADCAGRHDEAWAEYERSKDLAGDRGIIEWHAATRKWTVDPAAPKHEALLDYFPYESFELPVLHEVADYPDAPGEALELIRCAAGDPFYQDPTRQNVIAVLAANFGDPQLALACMRRGTVDMHGFAVMPGLWEAYFAPMRRDPGFKDLLRDLKLPEYWRETGKWADCVRPLGNGDFEIVG